MPEFTPEESLAELQRLGWTVGVTSAHASWKLAAVRGHHSWLYLGPDLKSVWDAARQMAAINGVAMPEPDGPK